MTSSVSVLTWTGANKESAVNNFVCPPKCKHSEAHRYVIDFLRPQQQTWDDFMRLPIRRPQISLHLLLCCLLNTHNVNFKFSENSYPLKTRSHLFAHKHRIIEFIKGTIGITGIQLV